MTIILKTIQEQTCLKAYMEVDIMASVIEQNFAFGANNSSYNISNAV